MISQFKCRLGLWPNIFILIQIVFLFFIPLYPIHAGEAQGFNFLTFTDIHLDAFNKHPNIINPSQKNKLKGKDLSITTFRRLLDRLIEENVILNAKPRFAMLLGDSNAHNSFSRNHQQENYSLALALMKQLFDSYSTPLFSVFGNNDSMQKDYGVFNDRGLSPYTIAMVNAGWKNGFLSSGQLCSRNGISEPIYPCLNPEEANINSGYYTAYLQEGLKLIALNTVAFDSNEMSWLSTKLEESEKKNENIIIGMHIPPSKTWKKKFLTIIANTQPGLIAGVLAAHTHMDELRAIIIKSNQQIVNVIPLIITPALSSLHGNAPGFKLFKMTRASNNQWVIQDIITYSFQQQEGTDLISLIEYYQFNDSYCPKVTTTVASCLKDSIHKKSVLTLMSQHYTAGNPNNIKNVTSKNWFWSVSKSRGLSLES